MFFKKQKPKIDPKVRFQNRQFNQKLQEARTFKRTARPVPESGFDRFLLRIGLGSRWVQILFALVVLGLVYLVYAPNFLSIQAIQVEGLSDELKTKVETAVQDEINSSPFYDPQRNILFLSKNRITNLLANIPGVNSIESINKNFKQKTLVITLKPKQETFLVRSKGVVYDVYNDGTLKGQAGLGFDSWATTVNPSMIKVDLAAKVVGLEQNQNKFFTDDSVKYMTELQKGLKNITGSTLVYFSVRIPQLKEQQEFLEEQLAEEVQDNLDSEVDPEKASESVEQIPQEIIAELPDTDITLPINADELDLFFQKGNDAKRNFKVIIDTKEEPELLIQRLNLLLSQTVPERYNNLSYIDLRIQSRAFICLLNTVCNR